jgi:hypothetical protein
MHALVGIIFRCIEWMFVAGIGGCTVALVTCLAHGIKLAAPRRAAHRRPGTRHYRGFLVTVDSGGLSHAVTQNRI